MATVGAKKRGVPDLLRRRLRDGTEVGEESAPGLSLVDERFKHLVEGVFVKQGERSPLHGEIGSRSNGFVKKTPKTPPKEILLAKTRREDYLHRKREENEKPKTI